MSDAESAVRVGTLEAENARLRAAIVKAVGDLDTALAALRAAREPDGLNPCPGCGNADVVVVRTRWSLGPVSFCRHCTRWDFLSPPPAPLTGTR